MVEPLTGMRGTLYAQGTEGSLVRDVADKIYMLQPDAAPLTTFTRKIGGKKVAINPKFEWFEDELRPNVVAVSGAIGTSTTIDVASGTGVRVRVGDLLIADSGESILVTAISTDALTVIRSAGSVASDTLASGDILVIAGNAMAEGSDNAPFRYTKKANKVNYIQSFKDSVELTEIQANSESYGGDDRKHQRMRAAIEHKRGIEQAFLFGDAFEDLSNFTQAVRGTGGLLEFVSTNVTTISGGTITESDFEAFMRSLFRYRPSVSAPTKLLLASPVLVSALNFWAKQALQVKSDEKTFGMRIASYRSGHGDLDIVNHWLLADFSATTSFGAYNFAVDPMNVVYRYMRNLDTKLHLDTQAKYSSKHLDEYRTVCGLQVVQEKTHGILKGVTGFAS